jgi:hypothetical protein
VDQGDAAEGAMGNSRASTSEPVVKAAKIFTAAGELERKRKVEEGTTKQVAQLKSWYTGSYGATTSKGLLRNHSKRTS